MKLTQLHDHKLPTNALDMAISADGATAFVACFDGGIYALDLASGRAEPFAAKHESYASGCVLSPDGKTLISSGYDGTLIWHDVATKTMQETVKAHTFWIWQLAISPDGSLISTVSGQYLAGGWKYEPAAETEPSVKLWDAVSGEPRAALSHTPPVLSAAFSPSGQQFAAANMMGEVRVWSVPAKPGDQPISEWKSPDFTSFGSIKTHHYCGGIYSLAFSPDGSQLVGCGMGPMTDPMAGNGKMTWQRWNWRTGEKLDQIKDGQHGTGLMESLAWKPDGSHFVMAGRQAQGTWNYAVFSAANGSLVSSVDNKKRITRTRFSPDGKKLYLCGGSGQANPKNGEWPHWGAFTVLSVEA